jgi:hypothetical protein
MGCYPDLFNPLLGLMKPRYARLTTAAIGAPIAGLLVVVAISAIEHRLYGPGANQDNGALRAQEIVGPLLKPAFVVLCWVYVVPASWFLTRRRVPALFAALLLTLPVWFAATVLLYAPSLDQVWVTGAVIAVLVGLPVFAAALVATAACRPNKGAPPNGGPATPLGNSGVTVGPPSVS